MINLATVGALLLFWAARFWPVVTVSSGRAGTQPRVSLVSAEGYGVLAAVAVPLGVCLAVRGLLATITILIGAYVLPVVALLLAACGVAPRTVPGSPLPGGTRMHESPMPSSPGDW
ncbi:MAG: hypothetical protein M3063_14595 [Actinomycetota bacterium]|nr:hypothetical protein [Actinomycetota bacterium]